MVISQIANIMMEVDGIIQYIKPEASSLELDHLSLSLLVATQLEMFATSQWSLLAVFAFGAFHTQHNFLGCLGLKK